MSTSLLADDQATIVNKAFSGSTDTGIDLEVRVVTVDSVAVAAEETQVKVAAGRHTIEVLCATKMFGGMGRADLSSKTSLTADLKAGQVYQLDAQPSERGACAPELKSQ